MTIGEATPLILGVPAAVAGIWAGYWAIRKQVYTQIKAETRLTSAEQATKRLEAEAVRYEGIIDDLQGRLDFYELDEIPRLKDRIMATEGTQDMVSEIRHEVSHIRSRIDALWTRWGPS